MSDLPEETREERLAAIVGAVARQALQDRGLERIAMLDDGSPEAGLAARWLAAALEERRLVRVRAATREVESVLHALAAASELDSAGKPGVPSGAEHAAVEVRRLRARLERSALVANPANKTALLLGGHLPPEPLLPLGDLYGSQVQALAGGWSAPEPVRQLAEMAGGIEVLDAALRELFDRRDPRGLEMLGPALAERVAAALDAGRASRIHAAVVPKIGSRTLGVDLFE